MFEQDIHFNISLGCEEIREDAVIDAAEYVYAHDFILDLADQYQFELKNNGYLDPIIAPGCDSQEKIFQKKEFIDLCNKLELLLL